jgi:hypothetical protein
MSAIERAGGVWSRLLIEFRNETSSDRRFPTCSIGAIACMVVIVATVAFLATPEGQAFNERVFGRYYTVGMILAFGVSPPRRISPCRSWRSRSTPTSSARP